MILEILNAFAERNGLDPNFELRRIGYVFEIDAAGKFIGAVEENAMTSVPRLDSRGNRIEPKFFVDTPPYVVGLGAQDADRRVKCHGAFLEFVAAVAKATGDEGARAVEAFLRRPVPKEIARLELVGTEWCTFRLAGDKRGYVFERPKLRAHWIAMNKGADGVIDRCRVSGRQTVTARLHPKIGMPDSKGSAIVSFNLDTAEFEGRRQGANFPTAVEVAQRYGAAAKYMLEKNSEGRYRHAVFIKSKKSVMGTIFAFTLDGRPVTPLLDVLDAPYEEDPVKRAANLASAWAALSEWANETEELYILVLKSNQSRIMVLDFFHRPLGEIVRNLRAFRADFADETRSDTTVNAQVRALVRPDGSLTPLALPIFRSALLGLSYPEPLLLSTSPSWRRAARRRNRQEETSMALNPEHPDWRYHLGRLCMIVKELHYKAYGKTQQALGRVIEETVKNPLPGLAKLRLRALQCLDTLERKGHHAGEWRKIYLEVSDRIEGIIPPNHFRNKVGELLVLEGIDVQRRENDRIIASFAERKNAARVEALNGTAAPSAQAS